MNSDRSDLTRRRFLSTSIAGLAAAGLVGVGPRLASAEDAKTSGEGAGAAAAAKGAGAKMIYRDLGKTGIKIPIVSMGAMNAENPEIVKASYEAGVRHFDTAASYAFGRNEQMLGKVIKDLGVRDRVVIGTKQIVFARQGLGAAEAKAKFIKLTEASLSRLQTDYVDIIYMHDARGVEGTEQEASFAAMEDLKKAGKARATGLSTHQAMAETITTVTKRGLCDVVLTSFNVSMAGDTALLDAIKAAAAAGIGIVAMKTQAGGRQLANQDALAKHESATQHKAMLKWALRHDAVATAIPGYTSYQQMTDLVSAGTNLDYTEDEKRFLADGNLQVGLGFCRQCGSCLACCPHGADVPTLVRTHMYAAQYANFDQARITLDGIRPERGLRACARCSACTATCANSVDIAYRIGDLRLIYG